MRVEEEYLDVLQNIETAIVNTYRQHRDMSDYEVMRALEALIDAYSGEKIGRPPRDFRLSENEKHLMKAMREMCEWRLGRADLPLDETSRPALPSSEAVSVDEIIICLKRLIKSAKLWNKEGGRQGYLNYIRQFAM